MMPKQATYMVMGNGEIGVTIAARLQVLQMDYIFVGRRLKDMDLICVQAFENHSNIRIQSLSNSQCEHVKMVFVCMEPYDLKASIERYLPYIPKGASIVSLCSGATLNIVRDFAKKHPDYYWRLGYHTFDTHQVSLGLFKVQREGVVCLGEIETQPQQVSKPRKYEASLLRQDAQFFIWKDGIHLPLRRKWYFEVVTHTLSVLHQYQKMMQLLDDLKGLRQLANQVYQLSEDVWEVVSVESQDKWFEDLVGYISQLAQEENYLVRRLKAGEKNPSAYFSGLAVHKIKFSEILQLSQKIDVIAQAWKIEAGAR